RSLHSKMKLHIQSQITECGIACLAMVSDAHGYRTDIAALRERFPTAGKGMTLQHLIECAGAMGFSTRPLRLDIEELRALALPCILHWDLNHYVVLAKVGRRNAEIYDPAHGIRRLSQLEISRHFTGVALECSPNVKFERKAEVPRVRLSELTGRVVG